MQHEMYELKQMQSLPLEMKIRMTKERIEAWYESWHRFEIYNEKTKKSRYKTIDVRDGAEPQLRDNEILRGEWGGRFTSHSAEVRIARFSNTLLSQCITMFPPYLWTQGLSFRKSDGMP